MTTNNFEQSLNNSVLQLKGLFCKKQHVKHVYLWKTKRFLGISFL